MANCKICNKPIVLLPSAVERAAKYGGTPQHYIDLFDTHPRCFTEQHYEQLRQWLAEGREVSNGASRTSNRVGMSLQQEPVDPKDRV